MNELRTSTRIYFWLWRCYKTYFRASLWNHLPVECWSSFRSFSILDDQLKIFIENILVLLERVHLFVPWECILEDVLWPPNKVTMNCCVSCLLSSPTPHLVTIYWTFHCRCPVVTCVTQWHVVTVFVFLSSSGRSHRSVMNSRWAHFTLNIPTRRTTSMVVVCSLALF